MTGKIRLVDEPYLMAVRWCPCTVCGKMPRDLESLNVPAHIRFADAEFNKPITGIQIRPDDIWVLPLCRLCHTDGNKAQHRSRTHERLWWDEKGINAIRLCVNIRQKYTDGMKSGLSPMEIRDQMTLIIGMGWVHG